MNPDLSPKEQPEFYDRREKIMAELIDAVSQTSAKLSMSSPLQGRITINGHTICEVILTMGNPGATNDERYPSIELRPLNPPPGTIPMKRVLSPTSEKGSVTAVINSALNIMLRKKESPPSRSPKKKI